MKKCKKCGEEKPLSLFYKDRNKNDGHRNVCQDCDKRKRIEYYSLNKEAEANRYKEYAGKNAEKIAKKKKETRGKNALQIREYARIYHIENREKRLKSCAAWYKNNANDDAVIARIRSKSAKRRAAKINSVVPWTNEKEIRKIYAKAREMTKNTGVKHEVDHHIPLQGKLVCGLHVHENLKILTKKENSAKRNYFPYDA